MNIVHLFQGETCGAAVALAVLAFVVGAVAACLVCRRACGGCGAGAKEGGARRGGAPRPEVPDAVKFQKRHAPPADGSIEIYVGNLSYDLTEDRLRREFEAFGKVNSARIITNRYNGKSKGFGFVHMPNEKEVDAALAALNEKEILGRRLKCNVAKNVG